MILPRREFLGAAAAVLLSPLCRPHRCPAPSPSPLAAGTYGYGAYGAGAYGE